MLESVYHRYMKKLPVPQEFIDLFPTTANEILAEKFGVSRPTIQRWACDLGLSKTPEYKRAIQSTRSIERKLSELSRDKIRQKALGRVMSDEAKAKALATKGHNGKLLRGARHPLWKGGRPWERFKDKQYLAWRNAVLERDNYICQQCRRQCKKHERGLAAHHIKPYAQFSSLRYDINNGLTMCRQCHLALHGRAPQPKEPIPCACGCGTFIQPFDKYGRSRSYVNYHGAKGKPKPELIETNIKRTTKRPITNTGTPCQNSTRSQSKQQAYWTAKEMIFPISRSCDTPLCESSITEQQSQSVARASRSRRRI